MKCCRRERALVTLFSLSSIATALPSPQRGASQSSASCQPAWTALGGALNGPVYALTPFDDGSGPALYVGGSFTSAGGVQAKRVAKWDGSSWSSLGSGMEQLVLCLTVFDDGAGPALYAGGVFNSAGGTSVNHIAKWNGSSWSPLGSGTDGQVNSLATFDDGTGPALYAGGFFVHAGGTLARSVAKWNGSSWSALGIGMDDGVYALAVFDDGNGPALYAGGRFSHADGIAVHDIARWNGSSWSPLLQGMSGIGGSAAFVNALTVFDDGSGAALYAGGEFSIAGTAAAFRIAKWNGLIWSGLRGGISGTDVDALTVFDDGTAPALYVGGNFGGAGGIITEYIARWSGSTWSNLGAGVTGMVNALAVFDDGSGTALYAGGWFGTSPAGDAYLAKWASPDGCGMPGSSMCEPGASGVIACPCNNAPSTSGVGCDNSASTGGASLAATGIARISYDTVVFTTSGEKPTATSIVLQGDSASSSGAVFGQGVRCVGGSLKRLYTKTASAGSINAPQGADLDVHARSSQLGDTIAPGTHRWYGVYYRDPSVLGGCPSGSTFNITQQLDVLWSS
jgi:hypothetical protein